MQGAARSGINDPMRRHPMLRWTILLTLALICRLGRAEVLPTDDGYRGIWYFNQRTNNEYRYKYSGGMATYPQQHLPLAVYSPQANNTFFVYGGTTARTAGEPQSLLHMIS